MKKVQDFNEKYTSGAGGIRTPLHLSDCGRFVFVRCEYTNGKIIKKWFWACHRLFK